MASRERLKHHTQLMDQMASALGVDLQDAVASGKIDMSEVTDALFRCTDCSNPAHCTLWLADHASGAPETPGYCRNRDMMHRLRDLAPSARG